MGQLWTFQLDEEGWETVTANTYQVASPYHNSLGSLRFNALPDFDRGMSITGSWDDPGSVTAWIRCIPDPLSVGASYANLLATYDDATDDFTSTVLDLSIDSGWVEMTLPLDAGKTVVEIGVFIGPDTAGPGGDPCGVLYVDDVQIGALAVNELRHLGLAADQGNLYVTRDENEVLQLWTYDLATLTFIRESTFGAATYAELDARTYGLMPEIKPGAEGVVYLRGRDGSDVKIQESDESQLVWTSLDDGGWAADKFAVALHPDPLNPADLVAVFSDNDIYRSQDGGTTWTKTADSTVTPREASRHPLDETDLLIAGTGAGANELEYTPNYGLSLEDVSEATMGIVNAIEVSR